MLFLSSILLRLSWNTRNIFEDPGPLRDSIRDVIVSDDVDIGCMIIRLTRNAGKPHRIHQCDAADATATTFLLTDAPDGMIEETPLDCTHAEFIGPYCEVRNRLID